MPAHPTPGQAPENNDVVSLLEEQHRTIRLLLDKVLDETGTERRESFSDLMERLIVHETAEEEIVHPYARHTIVNGEQLVADRLLEEESLKQALLHLELLDPDTPEFVDAFEQLRQEVLAHDDAEEAREFPALKERGDFAELQALAQAVRAAAALAPMHPHPGLASAKENIVAGPAPAVYDRARDAIRKVLDEL
ncbi:hemerythrin domain-containing protein [Streptomyces mirabilis]